MNYFVGFGRSDTKSWMVRPDRSHLPGKGDEVFLIRWVDAGPVLVGIFTIGALTESVAGTGVVSERVLGLPDLVVPPNLFSEAKMEEAENERWLHPINQNTGRVLHGISQTFLDSFESHLSFGKKRTRVKKEKGEKSPEQQIKAIELKAKTRLGQAAFRYELIRAYGGCCAISGCSVDEAISAAHILNHSVNECQEAWNGILLRADIHLLFDRHLLRIFPGNPPIVMLDPDLQETESYKDLHRRPMREPNPFDTRTNAELRVRWDAANEIFGYFPDP